MSAETLDWDQVLDRVKEHLATIQPASPLVVEPVGMPAWIRTSIHQAEAIVVTMDQADWEDRLENLIRPQIADLLDTLHAAEREAGHGSHPALPTA